MNKLIINIIIIKQIFHKSIIITKYIFFINTNIKKKKCVVFQKVVFCNMLFIFLYSNAKKFINIFIF